MYTKQKPKKQNKVVALEGKLYDFFVTLGDREEDLANGGSFRGHHYEPLYVPLGVVNQHLKFDLQGGWAYRRLEQLAEIGLYDWRKLGPGKPSFLKLLVWDHDEHFAAKAHDRIQRVVSQSKQLPLPVLTPEFIAALRGCQDDVEAYDKLRAQFTEAGRGADVATYWNAYKEQR